MQPNPHTAIWEYTLRCNSRCLHCGSDAKEVRKNELTTEESLDLVQQLAALNFQRVVLSGGEPTLRSDWKETAARIKERGVELGIISNALAWDSRMYDEIAALEPFSIGFSVDGEEELHDYLRGVKGSHRKVMTSIKELKKRGQTVCVVTTVNSNNLKELYQLRNRMIVYEIDAWQLQTLTPMGRMKRNDQLILSQDDYYRLAQFVAETREKLPYMNVQAGDCVGYFGRLESRLRDEEWNGCGAGIEAIGIESDGTVKGCLSRMSRKAAEGNIRQESLRSIWESPTKFKYNRQFEESDLRGSCIGCEYGKRCRGGCQSQSIAFFEEFHNAPYCLYQHELSGGL